MDTFHYNKRSAGFTLIEILIAIVILSIGLLGVAGMQANSLRNNNSAYYRTQASVVAQDISDRIRANYKAYESYHGYDSNTKIDPVPACVAKITTGCTATELADYDRYQWQQLLKSTPPLLPDGRALINKKDHMFTITVIWREPHTDNVTKNKCDQAAIVAADMACFAMSFQI